jgi:hypothetical protein
MTSKDEKKVWLSDISKLARKSRSETEGRHKVANNSTPRTGPPGSSSSVQQLVASQTPPGTPTSSGALSPMSRAPSTTPTTPSPLALSISSSGSESSPRESPIAHSIPIGTSFLLSFACFSSSVYLTMIILPVFRECRRFMERSTFTQQNQGCSRP